MMGNIKAEKKEKRKTCYEKKKKGKIMKERLGKKEKRGNNERNKR